MCVCVVNITIVPFPVSVFQCLCQNTYYILQDVCVLQASVTEQTFSFWNRAPRMIFSISSFFFVPCFINLSAFVWGRMTLCYPLYLSVYQFLPFIWVFFLLLVDAIRVHSLCRLDAICYVMLSLMPFFSISISLLHKNKVSAVDLSDLWIMGLIWMLDFYAFIRKIQKHSPKLLYLSCIIYYCVCHENVYTHLCSPFRPTNLTKNINKHLKFVTTLKPLWKHV